MKIGYTQGIPKSSILIRFSIINHPFWGTPIFGNTHMFAGMRNKHHKVHPQAATYIMSNEGPLGVQVSYKVGPAGCKLGCNPPTKDLNYYWVTGVNKALLIRFISPHL